jgi:hypothetical protein
VGERKGVRLAHAIYALSAQAKGDEALLRDALKTYGASSNMAVNPKFRFRCDGWHDGAVDFRPLLDRKNRYTYARRWLYQVLG